MQEGQLIGRYQVEKHIGEGGMGSVWQAQHVLTRKRFALKTLHSRRDDIRRRFLREARAASAVEHDNVVAVHDVFEAEDGTPIMVMELLVGETLRDKLARAGRLPEAEVLRILAPVVSAVGTAHAMGIVHRDLKPENVFLTRSGSVKVLDFGVAKLVEDTAEQPMTQSGAIIGTLGYMAPEQAFGDPVDHRADVWALGVMLYEMLTGKRPVEGDSHARIVQNLVNTEIVPLRTVAPDVSKSVCNLNERMLAPKAEDRIELDEVSKFFVGLGHASASIAPRAQEDALVHPTAGPPSAGTSTTDPHASTQADPRQLVYAQSRTDDAWSPRRIGIVVGVLALGLFAGSMFLGGPASRRDATSPGSVAVTSTPTGEPAPIESTTEQSLAIEQPAPPASVAPNASGVASSSSTPQAGTPARAKGTAIPSASAPSSSTQPTPTVPSAAPAASPSGPAGISVDVPF
jgi:serine/threonine-protein kinase